MGLGCRPFPVGTAAAAFWWLSSCWEEGRCICGAAAAAGCFSTTTAATSSAAAAAGLYFSLESAGGREAAEEPGLSPACCFAVEVDLLQHCGENEKLNGNSMTTASLWAAESPIQSIRSLPLRTGVESLLCVPFLGFDRNRFRRSPIGWLGTAN